MKQKLFKTMLLLCALVAGSTNVWATVVTTTFANKTSGTWAENLNLPCEDGGLTWTSSATPYGFESSSSARGIQYYKVSSDITTTIENASVTKVVVVASTNANDNVNSISVYVGSTQIGSTQNMPRENNKTYTFETNSGLSGEIKVSMSNDGSKSTYIKSIAVTYTPTHTLTYSATNGSIGGVVYNTSTAVASGASVAEGGKVTLTAEPNDGYVFDSWEVSGTGATLTATDTNPTTFTMGTANATVTANFVESGAPITYSVTYNANGATSGDVPEDENKYDANAEVTVLGNTGSLAKTGYAFSGWNTQADGLGTDRAAGSTFNITANTTLYAKWTPYTITAQCNDDNYGDVELNGFVITATPSSGYTYASPAYTVSSGSATVEQNGDEFTVTPTSDCTVTINFEAIPTYTAHFSINGTIDDNDDYTDVEGEAIVFPDDPADIRGRKFIGWYTAEYSHASAAPEFVNTATAQFSNSDVTYYAVFATASTGSPVTDELTTSTFGSPSSYTNWSNKAATSSAIYAGNSTTYTQNSSNAIQIRTSSNTGIVTTTSGGKATKVTVSWNSGTTENRTLDIYGKNSAYTNATDLYNNATQGTKLGSLYYNVTINDKKTTTTELTINGSYQFIGLRSNNGAMYLDEIDITWTPIIYANYCTNVPANEAVTVGANGYTTYVTSNKVSFPAGVTGYIATATGESSVTLTSKESVPASTPIVLKASAGTYYLPIITSATDNVDDNLLDAGSVVGDGSTIYALGVGKEAPYVGVVGFYLVKSGVTVPAGKAYLIVPASVKEFLTFSFEDDADGINAIDNGELTIDNAAIYNLAGQRLSKMQKGINIVNGKKVLK